MRPELLAHALGAGSAEDADAGTVATETLRAMGALLGELRPLVGDSAARALYLRSLHLAQSHAARPVSDEPLADLLVALRRELAQLQSAETRAAGGALLSALVDLLVSLIGEPLTHRMLRTAWGVPLAQRPPQEPHS